VQDGVARTSADAALTGEHSGPGIQRRKRNRPGHRRCSSSGKNNMDQTRQMPFPPVAVHQTRQTMGTGVLKDQPRNRF